MTKRTLASVQIAVFAVDDLGARSDTTLRLKIDTLLRLLVWLLAAVAALDDVLWSLRPWWTLAGWAAWTASWRADLRLMWIAARGPWTRQVIYEE